MSSEQCLKEWVKYTHAILKGLPIGEELITKNKETSNQITKIGMESIYIKDVNESSYTISYFLNGSQKESIIYISELDN